MIKSLGKLLLLQKNQQIETKKNVVWTRRISMMLLWKTINNFVKDMIGSLERISFL